MNLGDQIRGACDSRVMVARVSHRGIGMARIRVGISGWSYEGWRGSFHPDDLPRSREPAYARCITDRSPPARKSRDVYVYFDNDAHGHAPHDALRLARRLGLSEDA